MFEKLRSALIGPPLATSQFAHEQLNKVRALAAFSPDALSSIAYANQEIYLGLVIAGSAGLALTFPIGLAITGVLILVALSYYQTIQAYPTGGGSYVVARTNLGLLPGLFAAAALLIDYLLTAAVSLTAGVEALASAFPVLWQYRVPLALGILTTLTLANLKGLRAAGGAMAIPVYLFLFTYLPMLLYGAFRALSGDPGTQTETPILSSQVLTPWLILHTFSAGCTALTGIEAISNGVPAFKEPRGRNAGRTLIVMALLMIILFLGSAGLTQILGIVSAPDETILSSLSRSLLGSGPAYLLIQASTMLILAVAANTSYAGFPRLAAILAMDHFLPHQLTSVGDRLVYANGILLLGILTGGLIVTFNGDTHALIPLFAVGAFLAFSLSQAGMVLHWWRERSRGWRWKTFLNGLGAVTTTITLLVIGVSKFLEGAWLTVLVIPALAMGFLYIESYYRRHFKQLSLRGLHPSRKQSPAPRVVIPIPGVHRGILAAMDFARSITDDLTAVYIETVPDTGREIERTWKRWWPDIPLVVVPSPYRSIVDPLLNFLDETDRQRDDGQLATIILPEIVPAKWWQGVFHNHTSWLIRNALMYRRRELGYQRAIIDIPHHLL